jgi:hypothetical protein
LLHFVVWQKFIRISEVLDASIIIFIVVGVIIVIMFALLTEAASTSEM